MVTTRGSRVVVLVRLVVVVELVLLVDVLPVERREVVFSSGSQWAHSPVGSADRLVVVRLDVVDVVLVELEVLVEVDDVLVEVELLVEVDEVLMEPGGVLVVLVELEVRVEPVVIHCSHSCWYMPVVVAQLVG